MRFATHQPRFRSSPREGAVKARHTRAVLALAVAAAAGCADDRDPLASAPGPAEAAATRPAPMPVFPTTGAGGAGGGQRPVILKVQFDVFRASVPLGEVSKSGKIWNHVEEDILPADWAAHLRRNGIRVGRGTTSSWAPIRAILGAAPNTRTQTDSLLTRGSGPLTLDVTATPRDQTLFLYRPGGDMAGATFSRSTNAIRIEYTIPPTELDSVVVWVMPEIRQRGLKRGWQVTPRGIEPKPDETSSVLRELAFQAVVPPDHFLLIGPSESIERQLIIGRAMLVDTLDGQLYESLYFITPRVIRVGGTGVPGQDPAPRT